MGNKFKDLPADLQALIQMPSEKPTNTRRVDTYRTTVKKAIKEASGKDLKTFLVFIDKLSDLKNIQYGNWLAFGGDNGGQIKFAQDGITIRVGDTGKETPIKWEDLGDEFHKGEIDGLPDVEEPNVRAALVGSLVAVKLRLAENGRFGSLFPHVTREKMLATTRNIVGAVRHHNTNLQGSFAHKETGNIGRFLNVWKKDFHVRKDADAKAIGPLVDKFWVAAEKKLADNPNLTTKEDATAAFEAIMREFEADVIAAVVKKGPEHEQLRTELSTLFTTEVHSLLLGQEKAPAAPVNP